MTETPYTGTGPEEPIAPVEIFANRFRSLAGQIHVAADDEAICKMVAAIAEDCDADRIVFGALPDELRGPLVKRCEDDGFETLQAPFNGENLLAEIDKAQVGVNMADFAIAEAGAVAELAVDDANRLVSTLPEVHIALLRWNDVVPTLDEAGPIIDRYFVDNPWGCSVSLISGPSRTGDIEMKLTLGVHGPGETHVILI